MKCLFCGSARIGDAAYPRPTAFNGKTFHYRQCRDCRLVFIDPLPNADDYSRMYAKSYHDQFYFKDTPPDHAPLFGLARQFAPGQRLLDYGCGDGGFLQYFAARGYVCTGVEYDPDLVALLSAKNPGIRFCTTDAFWANSQQFDIIYLGDVLEHMSAPADFLQQLTGRLSPGGILMAQGPVENNRSLALGVRKVLSRVAAVAGRGTASHVPYHIFFSNARNQQAVFERLGLATVHYQVYETAWPYPAAYGAGLGHNFKVAVARLSQALAKRDGRRGNRFVFVGRKGQAT